VAQSGLGAVVVGDVQLYLDLYQYPARGREQAGPLELACGALLHRTLDSLLCFVNAGRKGFAVALVSQRQRDRPCLPTFGLRCLLEGHIHLPKRRHVDVLSSEKLGDSEDL